MFNYQPNFVDIAITKNKKITNIELKNDILYIYFENDSGLKIWDDGQSCCENRYMCTDDTLSDFVGTKLLHIEIKNAPDIEDYLTCHEIQFLEVMTSKGCFTLVTHNEHNGYYGGFTIRIKHIKGNI